MIRLGVLGLERKICQWEEGSDKETDSIELHTKKGWMIPRLAKGSLGHLHSRQPDVVFLQIS